MFPPKAGQRYVLVIEDDAPLRDLYRTALRAAGFPVVAVEDGLHALHHLETSTPSAVVLDMDLPCVSGRDVYRELRAGTATARIPIVVASGKDVSDLNPVHFACILRKPIDADELIAAVQDCLRKALN
jgi:two-component system phosphate regulon response regulator PhoB